MRVSEFCGLTMRDLDFEKRRIRVDHQLVRMRDGTRYIEKTKTECGRRFIPMSDDVFTSLYNILANRKKPRKEIMIDGYAGFILLDKDGNPKVAMPSRRSSSGCGKSTTRRTSSLCLASRRTSSGTHSARTWPRPEWISRVCNT